VVVVLLLVGAAAWVRIPYYAEGPGPARDVAPMIDVGSRRQYPTSGRLIMTTVRRYQVTTLQALRAWLDDDWQLIPASRLFPDGTDPESEYTRSLTQMDTSKLAATAVVMNEVAGYPGRHRPGALVEEVGEGCPAFGELVPGDVIVAIDGRKVRSSEQAGAAIDDAPPKRAISFEVRGMEGEPREVQLTRGVCDAGGEDPVVGVALIDPFPFQVEISSGEIGGPSAGLMFALGLYDALTPGDLTRNRTIAGTGEILPDGKVLPIGGIRDKVIAAEHAGADIFLVPQDNLAELEGVDTNVQLIPVTSFNDAVAKLEAE
jgi:PDZ domain-containing protein